MAWRQQVFICLPEPMLTNHLWGLVAFTRGQFHKICSRSQSLISWVWKLLYQDYSCNPQVNEYNLTLWRWTDKWTVGQNEDNDITTLASLWWRHQTETYSALLALCEGNPPTTGHKGQLRGALTFSLICAWTNGCVINREAGGSRSLWRYCNERGSNAGLWCFLFVISNGLLNKQSRSRRCGAPWYTCNALWWCRNRVHFDVKITFTLCKYVYAENS